MTKILDHDQVERALSRFPELARRIPPDYLARERRRGQIIDTHRVYRWLTSGGDGWSGDQLRALEELVELLPPTAEVAAKIGELWTADDDRAESLATELGLLRRLLAEGHAVELEPAIGVKRPEMLVDGRVLVECKTMVADLEPEERLIFKICHDVPGGGDLVVQMNGELAQQDVDPLVREIAAAFQVGPIAEGRTLQVTRSRARLDIFVRGVEPTNPGSVVSTSSDGIVSMSDVRDLFQKRMKRLRAKARLQIGGHAGPAALVVDISQSRPLSDGLALYPATFRELLAEEQRSDLALVVAFRVGALFALPRFVPDDALERAIASK